MAVAAARPASFVAAQRLYADGSGGVLTTVAAPSTSLILAPQAGDAIDADVMAALEGLTLFVSAPLVGTGASMNIAHGFAALALGLKIVQTDALAAPITYTWGTHTTTNVLVTVAADRKFVLVAFTATLSEV